MTEYFVRDMVNGNETDNFDTYEDALNEAVALSEDSTHEFKVYKVTTGEDIDDVACCYMGEVDWEV